MSEKLDIQAYERQVVSPLRHAPNSLPGDLVTRYAVDLSMTSAQLRDRVAEVTSLWNRRAGAAGASQLAAVYKSLQRTHEDVQRQAAGRMDDPRWWREQAAVWSASAANEIAALAGEVRQWYGSAGFVLPAQLADLRRRHPGLAEADVMGALDQAGIPIITPVELPQSAGLDRQSYERLKASLDEAEAMTIAHLLHPGITSVRLLPGRHAPGSALTPIDRASVDQRTRSVEAAANSGRSRAATTALGILRTAESRGTDLRQLAIYHVLEKVRATRAAGQPVAVTLAGLNDLDIAQPDARLLAASLLALDGNSTVATGPDEIRKLVAAGRLAEARRQVLALPAGDAASDAARETVARADAEFAALLAKARAVLADGDEEEASRFAAAALAIARDDPEIAEFADGLPPPPPRQLVAVADGLDVKLSWQTSTGSEGTVRYRVLRGTGRPPANATDGVRVAEGDGTSARDAVAPAAQRLVYAVFATTNRLKWSRAAECAIETLPPVTDVVVEVSGDSARVAWRSHPQMARAVVRRRLDQTPAGLNDGAAIPATATGFADAGLPATGAHCYAITAVYRDGSGQERLSEPVHVTAARERLVRPVSALTIDPLPGPGADPPRVRISWRRQEGAEVRIIRAWSQCPWPFQTSVPAREVLAYGEEVVGSREFSDHREELTAELGWGRMFLTPFVFSADTALVGQYAEIGLTPPIGAVSHERRDGELLLSWEWPARASKALLSWHYDARPHEMRITRGERERAGGWARIKVGDQPVRVEVRAIEISPAGDAISGPRVVEVAAASRRLSYEVIWKPVLPGATPRACEVRLFAQDGTRRVTVVAVAKRGVARPTDPADGQELWRWQGDVPPDGPAVFPVSVPRSFRKPYWLCCFLLGGAGEVLKDPPINQMKVG